MKSFSKNEIENLINQPVDFKQAIIESKGFILYLADKYTINLTPGLLIETITPYSIRFISEHMKSHKYTPEQTEIVISYLREDPEEDETASITHYELNDLLKDIREENNIPKNADSLLNLSFNDFLAHPNEFVKLIYKSSDDFWGANEFFSNHYLIAPLFKKLTKEQFLQIEKETLYSCPALFNMSKHLMNDDDIRQLFNETVQAYYEHPERKKGGYKPRLDAYKNYQFQSNEKELFLKLLKNEYSSDYERIKDYKGFDHFFTKNEYIFNHNISGIQYLSEKEIADNLVTIRKGILAAFFQSHYSNFEKIYQLKISNDSFRDIFKPAFVKEIIEHVGGFHFHHFDRDNKKKTDFMNLFHQEVLTLCAENSDILKLVGYQNSIQNITSILEHDKSYFNQTYANAAQGILEQFNQSITTDVLFDNFSKDKCNCFAEYDIPELIFSSMKGKESVNYLFALIKIHNSANNWKAKPFVEEINRVIPLLPMEDVKTVGKLLNYKINSKLLIEQPQQNFEQNFLNFTPDIIRQMSFDNFKSIFEISKDFRALVIKENLDSIIIEEKLNHEPNRYRHDFISQILSTITDSKSPYYAFMKAFIKKNKDFMIEHYLSTLVAHPLRNDFIKLDTTVLEQDSYHKLENLLSQFATLSLEENKLSAIRENQSKKDRKITDSLSEEVQSKKKELKETFSSLFTNLSFDFYSQKIKEADTIKAIQLLNVANNNFNQYRELVLDKIQNLDFKTTQSLVNNKEFLSYIFDNLKSDSYNSDKRSVIFNEFTNEQNIELVETLLKNFNNPDLFMKQYNKNVSLSKVLYFIPETTRFEISNDLAIKHDTVALFHSYDYLPKETGLFKKHVLNPYTNEQILEAINTLNNQGLKIICKEDQNLPHSHLLSYNFKYNEKDGKNPYLNDYLSILKTLENDPINYLACVQSDILDNFIDTDKYSNRDLAKSAFYNEYINIDVINQAMKEIFSLHNEMRSTKDWYDNTTYKGVAIKNAVRAISSFFAFSYSSYDNKYESELSEEKSRLLLQTVIDKAPYLFFSSSTIGKLNTDEELSFNFSDYFHENMIEDFFINSSKQNILSEYFSLDYSKKEQWQSASADNFITTLVKHLVDIKDEIGIYKLDFIIKENKFNEDRPYGKKVTEFSSVLADFLSHDEYERLIEKSLGFSRMLRMAERLDNLPRDKIKPKKI